MRIGVLQRVCPQYRVPLYRRLAESQGIVSRLFIGSDLPHSKVASAKHIAGVPVVRLPTSFVSVGGRTVPWHVGLVRELERFDPDVVVCEGESHVLGCLQALWYRSARNTRAAIVHWSVGGLPGEPERSKLRLAGRTAFRRQFDAYLTYSSFGKERLVEAGLAAERIIVAANVGDVEGMVESTRVVPPKGACREALGLPDRFTAMYVGSLDANKRPELLLDVAASCVKGRYSFVIVGGGPLLGSVRQRIDRESLSDVSAPGVAGETLSKYYGAADVVVVPGRGGIVISEAMVHGVPVIVHQADGTEYDLVHEQRTGIIVAEGNVRAFRDALEYLRTNPRLCEEMGNSGRDNVIERWNTANMVSQVVRVAEIAYSGRNGGTKMGNESGGSSSGGSGR